MLRNTCGHSKGGDTVTSSKKDPVTVTFSTPGEYRITLEAWNIAERSTKTFTVQVDSVVNAAFDVEVDINNYTPATFAINNQSTGATTYKWLFDGAEPQTHEGKNLPVVTYASAGTYSATFTADNGSAFTTISKQIIEVLNLI